MSGIIPWFRREAWKIKHREGAVLFVDSLVKQDGRLSGPTALKGYKLFNSCVKPSGWHLCHA